MKRSVLTLLVILSTPLLLFGQSVWQGSCAVGTYGSLPSTGLYGASNSFAQNTLVTVENPETNKTATVLIIDRLKQSGLFLLVSKDAATAIGLSPGHVAQVRVTLAKQRLSGIASPGDLPYSPDSDVFPAAGVGNPKSLAFLDQYLKGAQEAKPTQPAQEAPSQAASPSPAPVRPSGPAQPATGPSAGTAPKIAGLEEPAAPGSQPAKQPSGAPPSPKVAPAGGEGPIVSGLEAARAPAVAAPPLAAAVAPVAPERAGSAPVVSALRPVTAPTAAQELALVEAPAVPEVRIPRPIPTGLAAAAPPAPEVLPAVVAQLPQVPPTAAPRVSELAQASPGAEPLIVSVSALPTLPSEEVLGGGPIVSALASASPPTAGQELAAAGAPTPELLPPQVSTLASGVPPTVPPESAAAVPAPQIVPAPGVSPAQVAKAHPAAAAPEAAPSTTEAGGAQAVAAGAHRTPVRPSSALAAGSYYVQLGAYFESQAALTLADNLSPDYPVSVYTFVRDKKPMYKVMIGPLNWAESGTLLYLFIDQGYTGAFVRKGE